MVSPEQAQKKRLVSRSIGWMPIILSTVLTIGFVPFLLLSRAICLKTVFSVPLFAAYWGLVAFPFFVFLVNALIGKKVSISFETKHKEVLLAFWIWTVLMAWVLFSFYTDNPIPLPGFNLLLGCG